MTEITPLITYLIGNESLPLVDRIREAVSVHFDFIMANPDLPKFLMNEVIPYHDRSAMLISKVKDVLKIFEKLQHEVNEASSRGEIEHFNVPMLFQSILAINIFPSLTSEFIPQILSDDKLTQERYLALRKAENVEIIMRRIKKQ